MLSFKELKRRVSPRMIIPLGALACSLAAAPAIADDPVELLSRLTDFDVAVVTVPDDRPAQLTVAVPIDGAPHTLVLERVSVWAPDARVLIHRADGVIDERPAPPPNTYRGTIAERPGSTITAAIKSDGFHAVMRMPDGETWEVAPMDGLGSSAVFRTADYAAPPIMCPVEAGPAHDAHAAPDHEHEHGGDDEGPLAGENSSTHVAEMLVEADVEYYAWNGSVGDTVDEMALVINNVNEIYERDVNITHVLRMAIVHTSEPDPYTTGDGGVLLGQFRAQCYSYPDEWFDLAMLFTRKNLYNDDGFGLAGIAHIGTVCVSGEATGVSEGFSSDSTQASLVAHELGHIWNARHCNTDPSCSGQSSPCHTMCSVLDGCDGDDLTFGPCAISAITQFRDSRACLEPGTNGIQWVQWRPCGIGCPESGEYDAPHNTVAEAVAASLWGGTVIIKAGSSGQAQGAETFPLVINRSVTLRPFVESAVIGP